MAKRRITKEDTNPVGEMIYINTNDSGIEQQKTEICGETWGRPMSNKGLFKAEMMMIAGCRSETDTNLCVFLSIFFILFFFLFWINL